MDSRAYKTDGPPHEYGVARLVICAESCRSLSDLPQLTWPAPRAVCCPVQGTTALTHLIGKAVSLGAADLNLLIGAHQVLVVHALKALAGTNHAMCSG